MTANQIAAMALMNLRPAHLDIAPLANSSVKTATVPTPVLSVMATQTALMVQTRMMLSAVTTAARKTSSSVKTRSAFLCPGTVMEYLTVQTAVMKTQKAAPRRRADRDSSSVPMDAVYHQAMCVMLRMTVAMGLMSPIKPAWVQSTSAMRTQSSLVRPTTAAFLSGPSVMAPMTASTTATSKAARM